MNCVTFGSYRNAHYLTNLGMLNISEVTFAHKIDYVDINEGVQFGFYPSSTQPSSGYIRMRPSAVKPYSMNNTKIVSAKFVWIFKHNFCDEKTDFFFHSFFLAIFS